MPDTIRMLDCVHHYSNYQRRFPTFYSRNMFLNNITIDITCTESVSRRFRSEGLKFRALSKVCVNTERVGTVTEAWTKTLGMCLTLVRLTWLKYL
jgi:hypothetical protein